VAIDLPVDGDNGGVFGGGALDGVVFAFNAGEDQPIDAAGEKCGEQILFALMSAVGISHHRQIAARGERILDAADDGRKDGVGDVGNNDPDRARLVGLQRIGGRVPAIVELLADPDDPGHDFRINEVPAVRVEGAGDGGYV